MKTEKKFVDSTRTSTENVENSVAGMEGVFMQIERYVVALIAAAFVLASSGAFGAEPDGLAKAQVQDGAQMGVVQNESDVTESRALVNGCVKDYGGRCFPLVVSASFGPKFEKYVYSLNLIAQVSSSIDIDGTLIYAESKTGLFTRIIYSPRGWVGASECGVELWEQARSCYVPRGAQVVLNRELTNAFLSDMDLLIKYAAVRGGIVVEEGYAYQCTRFAGAAFCLSL